MTETQPVATATIDETGDTITQEHVDTMVENMREQLEDATKASPPSPKAFHGKRTIGPRKLKLLGALQLHLNKLQRKGINAEFALRNFTDWKGPIKTPTKKISGIISQLVQLEL